VKHKISMSLLISAAFAVTTSALAAENTDYFYIAKLEASSSSLSGYRIYPDASYRLPMLPGCQNADFAEMEGLKMAITEDELLSNTVLAAFMAHRKVQLRLDGCGPTGRPRYRIVRMDISQ